MVFNLMRFSTEDGPGLRTTVFLKGCPLTCPWCHNPESQSPEVEVIFRERRCIGCGSCAFVCPQGILGPGGIRAGEGARECLRCGTCASVCPAEAREAVGREMTAAQVMAEILKDRDFFEESGGGVTFSGGEPLAQPEFLTALLLSCREAEIHTAVDTSGAAPAGVVDRVAPLTDLFLYDLKVMDDRRHRELTGAGNGLILANLVRLVEAGRRVVVRVPVIPGYNDDQANLAALAGFLGGLEPRPRVELLPYHAIGLEKYRLLGRAEPPPGLVSLPAERLEGMAEGLRKAGLEVFQHSFRDQS